MKKDKYIHCAECYGFNGCKLGQHRKNILKISFEELHKIGCYNWENIKPIQRSLFE